MTNTETGQDAKLPQKIETLTEIRQVEKYIQSIAKYNGSQQQGLLPGLAKRYNILLPPIRNNEEFRNELFTNIHTFLQTRLMLLACVSAKWSCVCAATAAIAASISVLLALFCG